MTTETDKTAKKDGPIFSIRVDNRTFTLDKITLGDWRRFKTEFGLNASDIFTTVKVEGNELQFLNYDNPNVLVALIVAALCHERPFAPLADLIAEVEAFDLSGLEFPKNEPEAEVDAEDPTEDGAEAEAGSEETDAPSPSGKSDKRRKKPGPQN